MRKDFLRIAVFAIAMLALPLAITAQDAFSDYRLRPIIRMSTPDNELRAKKTFEKARPILTISIERRHRNDIFPDANSRILNFVQPEKAVSPLKSRRNTVIWANLANKQDWKRESYGPFGYYSFYPVTPLNYTSMFITDAQTPARNGVQYKNGHLYGLRLDMTYAAYGIVSEYLYDTDTSTGETTHEQLDYNTQLNLAALETAQAADGTVYGLFYNSDGTAVEWGTVDYSTRTRTTIAQASKVYAALGITSGGQLYGVAADGNLYKIDKSNGSETLVGPTGLTLTNKQGQFYGQTGEINQADDTFYWCALDSGYVGGLYQVNLQNGAATKIADCGDQFYGMYIPEPEAADGAPAKITAADVAFSGGSLNGTVNFTAPTKNYEGSTITGNLTYNVKANGTLVASGNTTAGASVLVNVSIPESGYYDFVITTSNAASESPKTTISKWVGYDVPRPVTDIELSRNGQIVNVSWKAPTTGVHNCELGALTYDVYRINGIDTTVVAKDISETSYTDNMTVTTLQSYSYAVKAKSEGFESALATSEGIVVGDAVTPDWTETFDNANDFLLFTVVDANHDGKTWSLVHSRLGGFVNSTYGSGANDDWLFTPPVRLAPGRLYTVSFKARNSFSFWHNTLEVKWGTDTTADAMTNTLLETTTPDGNGYTTYTYNINVDAEGKYYIGFHDNSTPRGEWGIELDDISVLKGALNSSPQAVSNLKVTPADKGALSAAISFVVPTKNIGGNSIEKVDSIQIDRDGTHVFTLGSKIAGENVSWTDNTVPSHGNHVYTVTPYLGTGGYGLSASDTAFIGQDVPDYPKNITLKDNQDNILAQWDAFTETGANGGYINPSHVSVSLCNLVQYFGSYVIGDTLATSEKGATSVTVPQNPDETTAEDCTSQKLYQLVARANGDAGVSHWTSTGAMVIGKPLALPFKESLSKGKLDNGFAWVESNEQFRGHSDAAAWSVETTSADGDGGSLLWAPYTVNDGESTSVYTIKEGDETSINMPKVMLRNAANPMLYFKLNATVNDPAKLKIIVETPDGIDHEVKTIDLSTKTKAGWSTQSVDLSDYRSQRYIMVKFRGISEGSDTYIGIDDINIFDQLTYNLKAVGIDVPERLKAGKSGKATVYVENNGSSMITDYSVVLYNGTKAVDTVTISSPLQVFDRDTVTLELHAAPNQTEDMRVHAEVVYDNDLDTDDNTTETKTVKVRESEYTKVNDLRAGTAANGIDLRWTRPSEAGEVSVIEDFEDYDAFATTFGDWTLVDGDKGKAGGFFRNHPYPGEGSTFAFDVFNPRKIVDDVDILQVNPGLNPHSGNQYAAAPYATDAAGTGLVDADNWLISPELDGRQQTISFFALNIAADGTSGVTAFKENFDVLYSTTTADTTKFIKIESDIADGSESASTGVNWKPFTVQLPEGARYFAIHHNTPSNNSYLFGLDDISFMKKSLGSSDSIIAYNIYRDGELIGSVNGNIVSYIDSKAAEGSHVYNVTVVYLSEDGETNESGFSNDATVVVTGINEVKADSNGYYNVYTIDGKTLMIGARSISGLTPGLYIIKDKKYIIK